MLIDPGSVGCLCGDRTAKTIAKAAAAAGYKPKYEKRERPLQVSGVGHGAQQAPYDCHLPMAFRDTEGNSVPLTVKTPTIADSDVPCLIGLTALRK